MPNWRRQMANDGTARVFVPASALHDKAPGSDMGAMAAAMDTAMGLRRQQLDRAEARADRAETAAAALREQIETERQRADRAEQGREGELARAAALQGRVDDLNTKLIDAQAELAAAQDQAEAARKAQAEAEGHAARVARGLMPISGRGGVGPVSAAWRGEGPVEATASPRARLGLRSIIETFRHLIGRGTVGPLPGARPRDEHAGLMQVQRVALAQWVSHPGVAMPWLIERLAVAILEMTNGTLRRGYRELAIRRAGWAGAARPQLTTSPRDPLLHVAPASGMRPSMTDKRGRARQGGGPGPER